MTSFYTITRGGVCSLYIRVRRDRNDVKYSTGIKVDADKWRRHKEKASTMMLADRLKKGIDAYMLDNPDASAIEIRSAIKRVYQQELRSQYAQKAFGPMKMSLNQYIRHYLEDIESGYRNSKKQKPFAKSSVKSIAFAMQVFDEFQTTVGRTLDFDDIDPKFLYDYAAYLDARGFRQNTASKCVKELKTIMGVAKFEGLTDNTYFDDKRYGLSREDIDSIALNEDELVRLMMADLSGMPVKAELARDLFIAGVCLCLRHSDYSQIDKENLEIMEVDGKKVWVLHIRQQKTENEVTIPCRPELKAILKKYDYHLPSLTQQTLNRHIKKIARVAGIDTPTKIRYTKAGKKITEMVPKWSLVSTHTARRTGATLMYYKGVDVYDIMRITGHRSPEMLRKYIKAEAMDTVRKLHNTPFFRGE